MFTFWRPVFTFWVMTVLIACVSYTLPPSPIPSESLYSQKDCTEVVDDKPKLFPFRGTGETVIAWIQDQYDVTQTQIKGGPSANGRGYYYYWRVNTRKYAVTRRIDAQESAMVRMRWENFPPTLADILRCLGEPPLYRAYHFSNPETTWTYLELWYPQQGIMVTVYNTDKVATLRIDYPIAYVSYVQPGSPEELIPRLFRDVARGTQRYFEILRGLRSWPGDITKITIDEKG